jgi:uncharacterized membrane protein YbhN (UPF0104 family)
MFAALALAGSLVVLLTLGIGTRRGRRAPTGMAATSTPSHASGFWRAFTDLGSLRLMTLALALSLFAWALQVATYHLVARAAHLRLPLTGSVAAVLSVGISFLIRATPGNIGVFQAVYALTVRWFGVGESDAVATALLIQIVQLVPTVLIGSLVTPRFTPRDAGADRLRAQTSAESESHGAIRHDAPPAPTSAAASSSIDASAASDALSRPTVATASVRPPAT